MIWSPRSDNGAAVGENKTKSFLGISAFFSFSGEKNFPPPAQFFIGIQKSRFIRMLKKVLDSFIDIGGRAYFIQEECFLSLSLPLSCPQTLSFALVQPISCFLCSFFSSVFNICLLSLYLWFFLALQFCHFIFLNILFSLFLISQCSTISLSILLSLYNSIDISHSHSFPLSLPFSLKNSLTLSHYYCFSHSVSPLFLSFLHVFSIPCAHQQSLKQK